MPVNDATIRRLHEILLQLADVRGQIDRGPKQIKAAQARAQQARDTVTACREDIKKNRMEADRKQLEQRQYESKIYDWQGKLNGATKEREFQAIKNQIAADTQANSVLSDEIFEILENVDSLQTKLATLEGELKTIEEDSLKAQSRIEERIGVLQGELVRIEAELKTAEAELPGDFAAVYHPLVKTRAEEAFAPLDDRSCGGCNTGLPPRVVDQLRQGHPVPCSSCGRWLYRPE
ncbi:MAG: zinc ribbon domain-containing protein [Pirellula sp.]|jgi:predicted  nucleic acid-binding Zn-ribbon protein